MSTQNDKLSPLKPSFNDRRVGIDRRVVSYDCYIPERRGATDRRRACGDDTLHGEWRDRRRYA
ncbi:hypothetical protein DESC_480152 [Desulfosarcina cetonica]|nr:hypothetical protein DESC_480152 [Desulfosarcina cetonica]